MKKALMISLGCAKNRVDAERMLGRLREAGYGVAAREADADVIIVNTCGFIESAKEESIEAILAAADYRARGKKLIVTGCLAQRYSEALKNDMPEIDALLGVNAEAGIVEAAESALAGRRVFECGGAPLFDEGARVRETPGRSAYVKISDGCDNRCAYCAIPLIRGGYRSRPFEAITDECRRLAGEGARELTLIAQDTSRYGCDLGDKRLLLPELLTEVSTIAAVKWLRVLYCYPDTVDERLLDAVARLPKVCDYLDLPLQHINGRLLKAMNRRGSPERIRALIAMCRERGIIVRTTFIVGFPGETEAEFSELMDFAREAKFDRLGAFAYSPEEGTPACDMPGQIAEEVKADRLDRLMTLQQGISLEKMRSRVGEECEVLIERADGELYEGRSRLEAPEADGSVYVESARELAVGDFVKVKITEADEYDLRGEAI